MVHDAIKVIEHGPKRPLQGGGTGERWEVSFQFRRGEKLLYLVFWQDGADIYVLRSASSSDLSVFEDLSYANGEHQ